MKKPLQRILIITLCYISILIFLRLPFWQALDHNISLFLINHRLPWLTESLTVITHFADKYTVVGSLLILTTIFIIKKNYQALITFISVSSFTGLINSLIKIIIQRERPIFSQLVSETSFSFPSGHASAAVSLYGNIGIYLFRKANTKAQKVAVALITSILILLIGFSRVYLGVHWFSDILGGYCTALYSIIIIYSIIPLLALPSHT